MTDFDTQLVRHGEAFIQAVLEDWERANKIKHPVSMLLEDRWAFFLRATDDCSHPSIIAA